MDIPSLMIRLKKVQVAVEWVDLDGFKVDLVARLLGGRARV